MFITTDEYDRIAAEAKKENKEPPPLLRTTDQSDLATLRKEKSEGKSVEPKLEENLTKRNDWWYERGQPNFTADEKVLVPARLYGAKNALLYTAAIPAALAVGFLLLILYFAMTGGYQQVHIDDEHGGMGLQSTPR
jgi:hypothetical protein